MSQLIINVAVTGLVHGIGVQNNPGHDRCKSYGIVFEIQVLKRSSWHFIVSGKSGNLVYTELPRHRENRI